MTREGGSQSLEAVKWTRQGEGRLHGGSRVHKRLWGEFCEGGIGGIFMGDANSLLGRRRKGGGRGVVRPSQWHMELSSARAADGSPSMERW
jgi:hypothetical protein